MTYFMIYERKNQKPVRYNNLDCKGLSDVLFAIANEANNGNISCIIVSGVPDPERKEGV